MVDLELSHFSTLSPVLNHIQVAQDHIHSLGPTLKPGAAIHQATPRPRRLNCPSGGESSQVNRPAVIQAKIPITADIGGSNRMRTAQHDSDSAGHRGQHLNEFSDRLRKVGHNAGKLIIVEVTVKGAEGVDFGSRC
jgi:hypothetical protein